MGFFAKFLKFGQKMRRRKNSTVNQIDVTASRIRKILISVALSLIDVTVLRQNCVTETKINRLVKPMNT